MRAIPESLKAKMRLLAQTKASNADPRIEAIISRHVIPIQDYTMWQTFKVANFSGRVSISVPRPDYRRMAEQIFVAGIDAGTAKIYSADFDGINAPKFWTQEALTILSAVEISMAFEGRFRPYKKRTEFYTTEVHPWIVWIDAAGDLWAQHWDDAATKTIIAASATSCSATMGINSVQNDWGYGLMIAWTTVAGAVFYAQLTDGIWSAGIAVTQAPANATEIVISRVEDARMTFLVKDSAGALTSIFFRSIAISMSNFEKVEMKSAKISTETFPVFYHDTGTEERVEMTTAGIPEAVTYSILEPEPIAASNVDDGAGNFGRFVILTFKETMYDFENVGSFTISGTSGPAYNCYSIARTGEELKSLLIEFQDFNNAPGDCTITYTPGTLSSGVTLSPIFTQAFTTTGLIPVIVDPPKLVTIINIAEVTP